MNVVDIGPDLSMVLDGGPGQAYLLRRDAGVVLVDTGIAGQGSAIAAALRGWGLERESLTHVVLTHWHPDHVGSAAELAGWPNVQIWAHRADAPIIRGEAEGRLTALTHAEAGFYAQIADTTPQAAPSRVDSPTSTSTRSASGTANRCAAPASCVPPPPRPRCRALSADLASSRPSHRQHRPSHRRSNVRYPRVYCAAHG